MLTLTLISPAFTALLPDAPPPPDLSDPVRVAIRERRQIVTMRRRANHGRWNAAWYQVVAHHIHMASPEGLIDEDDRRPRYFVGHPRPEHENVVPE